MSELRTRVCMLDDEAEDEGENARTHARMSIAHNHTIGTCSWTELTLQRLTRGKSLA
jgi:hypothetical protein